MANENEKRSSSKPQPEDKSAAPGEEKERQANAGTPEHRYRSQRTDLLEGDPAGTAFSEEMGHTPTRL